MEDRTDVLYIYMTKSDKEIPSIHTLLGDSMWDLSMEDYDCVIEQLVGDYMEAQEILFEGDTNGRKPTRRN